MTPDGENRSQIVIDLGQATEKQALFYSSRALYTAYGGARGGGKTHAVRVKAVGGALRYGGIKILIIRRTYPELQANHIEPVLRLVPKEAASYNGTTHTMYFKNGSIIKFGHYQGPAAENEYQGQEYDWIFMDEATQFLESEFRFLGGLLRGVNSVPKRFYLTCNPGGVGHRWVKRLFIDRRFITGRDADEENENGSDYAFIFASVEDNGYLMRSSPGYIKMLSSLPEKIRAAHRYGDWNALSGCYFDEIQDETHIIKPFTIPAGWTKYRAFDYGLDMFSCLWIAADEKGRFYVYREYREPGLVVSAAAEKMLERTLPGENIEATFAPPDMWSRQKDSGKTMAEIFFQSGVPILKAPNSRVQGHMQIKELLREGPGFPARLFIFSLCSGLIADLKSIQADGRDPCDCAREPHDVTHAVDALRYFCASRCLLPASSPPPGGDEAEEGTDYEKYMLGF